jgi:serine protease Do
VSADLKSIIILLALVGPLHAQQSLESDYRTTGNAVVAAFEPQRAVLQKSSAVMLDGRKEIAYGIVISEDGHILTKASEIEAVKTLGVTVDTVRYKDVRVVATDPKWDVALVKIDAAGLVPVVYAPTSDIPQGSWLVGNGASSRSTRRALPCVVSAKSREIPTGGTGPLAGVALGVGLVEKAEQLEISDVAEKGGAKQAGLEKGDVILAIDGKKVSKKEDIAGILKDQSSGSSVKVTIRRGTEEKTLEVKLLARSEMMDPQINRNDQMSGDVSKRRTGFPRVIQTDLLANSASVGGPLIDLDGRCVGMNIARANRSESFAIPVEELKKLVADLLARPG